MSARSRVSLFCRSRFQLPLGDTESLREGVMILPSSINKTPERYDAERVQMASGGGVSTCSELTTLSVIGHGFKHGLLFPCLRLNRLVNCMPPLRCSNTFHAWTDHRHASGPLVPRAVSLRQRDQRGSKSEQRQPQTTTYRLGPRQPSPITQVPASGSQI